MNDYSFRDTRLINADATILEEALRADLFVTSPPYNVGLKYENTDDSLSLARYKAFTEKWLSKCYEWANPNARLCVNVPFDITRGTSHYMSGLIVEAAKAQGWRYKFVIIWNKKNIIARTAWGSFKSASAPHVNLPCECILIFYKGSWKRDAKGRESDITKEEFIEWSNGLWYMRPANAKRLKHPAPFPLELPFRLIKLFSFRGDTVLDPFVGSATSLIAAHQLKRRGVGIEKSEVYFNLSKERLNHELNTLF